MELLYGFAEMVLNFLEAALGVDVVFGVAAMVETLLLMPFSSHSHSHSEKRGWCREGGEWRRRRQIGMKGSVEWRLWLSEYERGKCESEKCGVCRVGFPTFIFIV